MMRLLPTIVILCVLACPSLGQERTSEAPVGYLDINVDADHVELFLDGQSLGHTPLADSLVLTPGWYNVSFFGPEFKWSHWTHRQRRTVINVIDLGTYHVLVKPGESTRLEMAWLDLERQLVAYEQGKIFTSLIGMGMISSALFLISRAN